MTHKDARPDEGLNGSVVRFAAQADRQRSIAFDLARIVQTGLLVAYAVTVLWLNHSPKSPAPHIIQGGDSEGYLEASKHWPWHPFSARAAPLYPILIAALGRNLRLIVVVQTLGWIAAWQWLAVSLRNLCRNRVVGVIAGCSVLAMSLAPELMFWTDAIASEWSSMVAIVAGIASALHALRTRTPRAWVVTATMISIAVFARDSNAVIAVGIIAVSIGVGFRRAQFRRAAFVCAALCIAAVVGSNVIAQRADPPRWFYPLQENIVLRVSADPELLAYFRDHNMPQADEIIAMRPNYLLAHADMESGPKWAPFRAWLRRDGFSVYSRFVITHPLWQAKTFFRDRSDLLEYPVPPAVAIVGATPGRLYGWFGAISFLRSSNLMVGLVVMTLLLLGIRRVGWWHADRQLRWMLLGLTVSASVHALASYAGDVLETGRHALTATMQLRIATLLIICMFVDRVLTRNRHDAVLERALIGER